MGEIREIISKPEPDQSLIEMLEEMVEDAKAGRLLSIVGCYLDQSGENYDFMWIEPTEELKVLGCLEMLKENYKVEHIIGIDYEE